MDVSVIIVSFNTLELLDKCIGSVYAHAGSLEIEVIVIDNASTDGSAEMIEQNFGEVRLVRNSKNVGFASANNQAIKLAKGKFMLLLNSDTVVLDGAIEKTVQFAEQNAKAAVVGCRTLNPDSTLQRTCFMFPSVLNLMLSSTYLYKIFPRSRFFGRELMTWWDRNDAREVDVVSGCFMLVRAEAIKQTGIMDESFFLYAEETDWCYRFRKNGWKLMFTPDAQIIHYGRASSGPRRAEMLLQLRSGILLFIKKHRSKVSYMFSCVLVALFFLLRVPYWLVRWVVSTKKRDYSYRVLKAYLRGTMKSLCGAGALSVEG